MSVFSAENHMLVLQKYKLSDRIFRLGWVFNTDGLLAQLVEQLTFNQLVAGSIPHSLF